MVQEFAIRNQNYISESLQSYIEETTILIAGCGLGSVAAEIALRTGFKKFMLVDGDTVSISNLNRQIFRHSDIGKNKTDALKERLLAINPDAEVEVYACWLDESNVSAIVRKADIIFDTIDFLDLKALLVLHETATLLFKPVISSFSYAWGAFSVVFMPGCMSLKEFFGLDENTNSIITVVDVFQEMFKRLNHQFPSEFIAVTNEVFKKMQNGTMCPTLQLGVGVICTASIMITQAVRVLSNQSVKVAPEVICINLLESVA